MDLYKSYVRERIGQAGTSHRIGRREQPAQVCLHHTQPSLDMMDRVLSLLPTIPTLVLHEGNDVLNYRLISGVLRVSLWDVGTTN